MLRKRVKKSTALEWRMRIARLTSLFLLLAGCDTGGLLVVEHTDAGCETDAGYGGGISGSDGCETDGAGGVE